MSKAAKAKPAKFKYIVTLSLETETKVPKKAIRETILGATLNWIPHVDDLVYADVRVRSVDLD